MIFLIIGEKKYKIKLLLEETKAPSYEIAKQIRSGGFLDYEEFTKAEKLNVTTKEDYILAKKKKKRERELKTIISNQEKKNFKE